MGDRYMPPGLAAPGWSAQHQQHHHHQQQHHHQQPAAAASSHPYYQQYHQSDYYQQQQQQYSYPPGPPAPSSASSQYHAQGSEPTQQQYQQPYPQNFYPARGEQAYRPGHNFDTHENRTRQHVDQREDYDGRGQAQEWNNYHTQDHPQPQPQYQQQQHQQHISPGASSSSSLPAPPRHHQLPARPDTRWNDKQPESRNDDDRHYRPSQHDHRVVPPPRRDERRLDEGRWERDQYYESEYGYGRGASQAPPTPAGYHQKQQHQRRDPYDREEREQGEYRSRSRSRSRSPSRSPPRYHQQPAYRHDDDDRDYYDSRRESRYREDDDRYEEGEYSSRRRRSPPSDLPERPRRQPRTAPNQSVILIGIPPSCDGDDVRAFIDDFKTEASDPSPVEEVTIVKDKETGLSKRFCFVRFISLEHARAFVDTNYDHVFWKSRGSHDIVEDGIKIRVDYASDDRRPGDVRPRKRDHDQVVRDERPANLNDGSKDMGSTPNTILLLRNLDTLTNETHIAAKLENLDDAARIRTKEGRGPKRIILIKDRDSHSSWCFAFAIFPTEESAKAALRTILDPSAFPTGFTIQNKLAAVTFARIGCFTKAYAKTNWSFPNEGPDGKKQEYLYWDDAAYGLLHDCPAYINACAAQDSKSSKQDDVDAFLHSLGTEAAGVQGSSEAVQAPPAINLSLAGTLSAPGQQFKERKKPTELIVSKKIAIDINKWNQKKAEVASDAPKAEPATSAAPLPADRDFKAPIVPTETSSISTLNTDGLEFADVTDLNLPKCLLCQRQFKSLDILQKHSRQSDLHKTNLDDTVKVEAAKAAVSKLPTASTAAGAVGQYRDRALERRIALHQPDRPPPPIKRQKFNLVAETSKPVVSAPEKEIEETNIGSKLLAGMGWTSGSGLGSTAPGRVDPVQAKAFASGAGIGASRGVSATEKANETWGGKDFGRMKAAQRIAEAEHRQA